MENNMEEVVEFTIPEQKPIDYYADIEPEGLVYVRPDGYYVLDYQGGTKNLNVGPDCPTLYAKLKEYKNVEPHPLYTDAAIERAAILRELDQLDKTIPRALEDLYEMMNMTPFNIEIIDRKKELRGKLK